MKAFSASAQYKPEPRKTTKAREKRSLAARRAYCRAKVYVRAGGCCEVCGRTLVFDPQAARHEFEIAHIHEIQPRSLGGDETDPANCKCVCAECHAKEHRR